MRFATGERRGQAVQRQIIETDVIQEFQPLPDLHQDLVGDGGFLRRKIQFSKEFVGLRDVQPHDVRDGPPADSDVQCFRAQPRPFAIRTLRISTIAAQEYADVNFIFLGLNLGEELVNMIVD